MSDPHTVIRELIRKSPGQGTFDEYRLLYDVIVHRAPCNLLVFGAGRDSGLWAETNRGGRTVFLEDLPEWAEAARRDHVDIDVIDVRYRTRRFMWRALRLFPSFLRMGDLPARVLETEWDVIFVDGPRGTRWNKPGRMKSIYTASVLARHSGGTDVFVHDCHRRVERVCSDDFLGSGNLISEAGSMRRYRITPGT